MRPGVSINGKQDQSPIVRVGRYAMALAVVWTAVIAASLTFSLIQDKQETTDLARSQARIALEKDILYRRWNAGFGGVYVPVTSTTLPNPYLGVAERDITTSAGRRLTLINPAYMTRQVHELAAQQSGALGHITSLKPIRLENAPDPWERQALEAFERGTMEVSSIETINGKPFMRLMRPLVTEKGCLKCHAAQGYREGDIRGGISVSIPMATLWPIARFEPAALALSHGALWVLGLGGIALSARGIRRRVAERKRADEALALQARIANIFLTVSDDEMFNEVLKVVLDVMHSPFGVFGYIDEGGASVIPTMTRQIWDKCQIPGKTIRFPRETWGDSTWVRAFREKRTIHSNEPSTNIPEGHVGIQRHISLPILLRGEVIGLFQVANKETDYTEADIRTLDTIASQVAPFLISRLRRERAQKALRESEEKHRALFESSRDALMTLEPPSWAFTSGNPETVEMFRAKNEEEFISHGPGDLSPERQPDGRASAEKAMEMIETAMREESHFFEWTHKRIDGEEFPATVLLTRMELAGKRFLQATVRDITEQKRAEEALRDSEARYRALFERSTDGILVADMETKIFRYANPAICRMLGYTEDELRTMGVADIHPKEALQSVVAEFEAQARGDKTLAVNLPCLRKDGTILYADVNAGAITIDDRVCNVGLFRDVTERKRAEEALRETNEYLENLFNYANAPIIVWDRQFRITRFNHAFESLTGRKAGDMVGQSLEILFPPALVESSMELIRKTLSGERWETVEISILHLDGSDRTVLWNSANVLAADGKTPVATIAQGQDITERKRAEEALRDSEARYRALFERSTDGILIAYMETKIFRYANPAICRMLGYTEEELRTMGVADIHPKEALQSVMAEFEAQARGDKTLAPNLPCLRKDGTVLYADVNAGAITIDGRACNVGLFRDVTERKRAADALRESEERFRVIVENVGMGVVMLNRQMELLQMNGTMRQWFPDADAGGKPLCYKVLDDPPRDSPCPDCPAFLTHQDGRVHEGIKTVTRAGKSLHLRIRSSPVHDANNQVIGSIEVVEDVTEQETSRRRIEAAAQLVSQISPIGDRTRLLDLVIHRATDLLEADFGVIVELDSATGAIGAAYPAKFPLSRVPEGTQVKGQGMLGRIAGGEAVWTADITAEPGYVGYPSWHPHVGPCIGLPLRLLGSILGIMLVGREKGKPPFTEEDTNYARTLAHHAAVGIDRTRRMEALHALSLVDPLTGLKNRRGFLLLAEQQMKMASRVKRGLLLLFLDLDGLKWINDNLGHAEGDQALIAAAEVFKGTFRESDVIARMGGDEFAVLAVETSQTDAEPLEVRLQKNIEAWNDREHRSYALSLSVGVVRYDPESPCSLEELLTQADTLMYEQKREKRKVCIEKLAQDECGE